jgi:hypothetical protein
MKMASLAMCYVELCMLEGICQGTATMHVGKWEPEHLRKEQR